MKSILLATVSIAGAAVTQCASAQCMYSVQTIDSLVCPLTTQPYGYDVNNLGHVCGGYHPCGGGQRAFFWSPRGGFVDIDIGDIEQEATALNDSDEVVGKGVVGDFPTPFRWSNGVVCFLDPLPPPPPPYQVPAVHGYAEDIAPDGTVVGYWGGKGLSAFRWMPNAWFDDLTDDVGFPSSRAFGTNDAGWVCGAVITREVENPQRAFVLTPASCTILPAVAGGFTSEAHAISSNGYVCGWGMMPSPDGINYPRGFVWRDGKMEDVGSPNPSEPRSFVNDVNALGQVVGSYTVGFFERAFVWQNGTLHPLKPLLTSTPQYSVQGAFGINDRGQIVAFGGPGSLVLTPIRTRAGDATIDCKVDERDILAIIEFWGKEYALPDMPGDLNDDGVVNGIDLGIVLGDWG